jgi:hypothetical protein
VERPFTLAAQRMRSPKKHGDVLPPTAEGRTATQQLPSCCRGRSRPSRRHQRRRTSLTRLTQQSQSTGRRRRRGAAECAQKAPPCAPCARTRGRCVLGESGSQSRRFYRARRGWGGADGRETRTIRHCRTFSTCLPTSCGSPPPPPLPVSCASSALACCRRLLGPSTSTTTAHPWSVVVSKRLSAVW